MTVAAIRKLLDILLSTLRTEITWALGKAAADADCVDVLWMTRSSEIGVFLEWLRTREPQGMPLDGILERFERQLQCLLDAHMGPVERVPVLWMVSPDQARALLGYLDAQAAIFTDQ